MSIKKIIPSIILIGIFLYYFFENLLLSASWEVVSFRNIDDFAMQSSLHNFHNALISGDWKKVLTFFDYAYGNIFWLINGLLLLPLYFLGSPQALIVAGRELSLIYVFANIYLIGLVLDRINPNLKAFKFPIQISIALMPMVAIISTKFHVNAQSIFFGTAAFYFLVKQDKITSKAVMISGLCSGIAIGLKLTAIILLPLLISTLAIKNYRAPLKYTIRLVFFYLSIACILGIFFTKPALFLFPYFSGEWGNTYDRLFFFKNISSYESNITPKLIYDTLSFYFDPLTLSFFIAFYVLLSIEGFKNRSFIVPLIFLNILFGFLLILNIEHKGAIYIATYFISLSFFIPIGISGVSTLRFLNPRQQILLAYSIVICGLAYGMSYRVAIYDAYRVDYYSIAYSKDTQIKLSALADIKSLISPFASEVKVLQDINTIFPVTAFSRGALIKFIYGDLKVNSSSETYNYILLSTKGYYAKDDDLIEENIRRILINSGTYLGKKYRLIYNSNDTLLYELE